MPRESRIRSFDPARDVADVLRLINADRLKGQPLCTEDMLREAVAGRSPVDGAYWQSFEKPETVVMIRDQRPAGVLSYAFHREESSSYLLWVHGAEDPTTTSLLIDHFVAESARVEKMHAFWIATALTSGLEALPIRHRPVAHSELLARGFASLDLWRYMHIDTPLPKLEVLPEAVMEGGRDRDTWRIVVREEGKEIGFVDAGSLFAGIGVIWFLWLDKACRGRGLGRRLLGSALLQLQARGVREVILYVDDDERGDERDRTAANRLYDSIGFQEIDRLVSYERQSSGNRV
ncbi:MAG: GNAT family N-acetyltransferase [Gammaproteobacteria bacterium]